MKARLRAVLFKLLGKDPDAVVISFATGPPEQIRAMAAEMRSLIPGHRHFVVGGPDTEAAPGTEKVTLMPGGTWSLYWQLRRRFRPYRIGMAAVMFEGGEEHRPLRRAAFLLAPLKILAYNRRGERHHLQIRTAIASLLFFRGIPLDRIYLRPRWLCPWRRDRTVEYTGHWVFEGRAAAPHRRKVAVLSPYFPYPFQHGGAVRIFHLLREASIEFDIYLFAFAENDRPPDPGPVLNFCARAVLVRKPRYREPRWATLAPPEVGEYRSATMRRLLAECRGQEGIAALQTEYTQLAEYGGDVLVEHDVTFDLYRQIREKTPSVSAWWDWWRWKRFESRAVRRYARVVTMSEKDAALLGVSHARPVPNGVDLSRFTPEPEPDAQRLLFVGSFRHFPNMVAFRFLLERVWPRLSKRFPKAELTVVAGPEPALYWSAYMGTPGLPAAERVRLLEFVADVRPLYAETNLVLVPTLVSAGTNLKVLEAMAMERAVVSTSSGCAGLGLEHGISVWVADGDAEFAEGVARLIEDSALRASLAHQARSLAVQHFGWDKLGSLQRALWRELTGAGIGIRAAGEEDLPEIIRIQSISPESARWKPQEYLAQHCLLALVEGRPAGFLASRTTAPGHREILNVAVDPAFRRRGVGSALVREALSGWRGEVFLEVRASNAAAQALYKSLGFKQVGRRPQYYSDPAEDAVVMRRQS